ncbi:MAG: hypothetical protein HZA88_07870 [Verrucomicrobia bacterium]|nr:hypothetical protein [Verrucomicrobiota bacterium]
MRRYIASLLLFALVAGAAAADAPDMRRTKKLIATGWDKPTAARLRENLELMEQRPFDGVVIEIEGRVDAKKTCRMRAAFSGEPWRREWFADSVADLKACKFKRFTDNFITVGANPGNVDWFDDEGWRQIVEHWRIAAWLARQTKLKGILFDPEPYTPPHAQFRYAAQPQRDRHTFEEYCAKARQRGAEVMHAVAEEYPNLTIFCYFMNVVNATATGAADPRPLLAGSHYGLYVPFVDGWFDAAPTTVTLVDGCEMGYRFNSEREYLEAALKIKGDCQELVAPENRAQYRAQVQASFGIYLDAYWNPPTSPWFIDGKGGSRVARLGANVTTALRVADEYVWVYGEKFRWWPTPNRGVKKETWEEALPGCEDALRFARDPIECGRAKLASGKLVNLARNGDFGSERSVTSDGAEVKWKEGRAPAGWSTWQTKDSHGVFTWDREAGAAGKGSARAANVAEGCFIQSGAAKPDERYAVAVVCRLQGRGDARIRVRWQTPGGKWTAEELDKVFVVSGPRGEWREGLGVVTVPETAGKLVVLLGVSGQQSADDVAWFDDVRISKLE